ncbi:MAG: type I-E CRISPR-associated protein Cas5/CasD [Christensenellales bacterium]
MSTLLLRFAGPLQAWGADSRFDVRRTNREPTKSGVIGLIASALGLRRDAPLDELNRLYFGVRVDREGVLLRDLHTVRKDKNTSYMTTRYYLSDAVFLIGLHSDDEALMQRLEHAVRNPAHPLFLGRRSCPPEGRVCLGLRQMPLEEALKSEPSLIPPKPSKPGEPQRARIVLDDPHGTARLNDLPVSFSPYNRQYAYRAVREMWNTFPANDAHDPMLELGGD